MEVFMITEKIDLYEYFGIKRGNQEKGFLYTYILDNYSFCSDRLRPAMLVLGGGGYAYVSDRETEPIALSFLAKGYNAFCLDYTVGYDIYPAPVLESAMALIYIIENSNRYKIDKDKIAGIGFSAGGHLLGTLVTIKDNNEVRNILKDRLDNASLSAAVFSYAVVLSSEGTHQGSMENLFGNNLELRAQFSIDKLIKSDSCPAFIWCTADDNIVDSINSLALASAYKKAGAPFELHIFETGAHGLSLCNYVTGTKQIPWVINKDCEPWFNSMLTWLDKRFKVE